MKPKVRQKARPARAVSISPDLIRQAVEFAKQHDAPLLTRLCDANERDARITAWNSHDGGTYALDAADCSSGMMPRSVHLEWIRRRLADECPPDSLIRALGEPAVAVILDVAVDQGEGPRGLDDRTYARAYGGPHSGSESELGRWLDETICVIDDETAHDEHLYSFLRQHSLDSGALYRAWGACRPQLPWRHPDTAEIVGSIVENSAMMADGEIFATSPVAVSCLQWTADLMGIPMQIEVSNG